MNKFFEFCLKVIVGSLIFFTIFQIGWLNTQHISRMQAELDKQQTQLNEMHEYLKEVRNYLQEMAIAIDSHTAILKDMSDLHKYGETIRQ